MSDSNRATEPRPPTIDSTASPSAELLRLSVNAGRFTSVAGVAFALAFVLALLYEGQWIVGGLVGVVLVGALVGRIQLCRRLLAMTRSERLDRAHWFTGAAGLEGALWAASLLLAAPANPVAALLQFEITVAITMVGALTYGIAGWAGVAFGAAIALGQLGFLLLRTLPMHELIALAWLLTLAAVTGVAFWLRNALGDLLISRARADRVRRVRERAAAELNRHREQLRLALDAIDAGVSDTNLQTGERFLSARYAAILGYRDAEGFLRTHRFSESLHPEDQARVRESRRRHIEQGERFEEEFRLRTAAGTYVWVHARGESVRGSDGKATRFVMSILDVTARRNAERQLAASERRYRALVDASPSLIWACDARGRLTYLSARALQKMYGYEPNEALGRHVLSLNAPHVPVFGFRRRFHAVLRGRPVFDVEVTHLRADGQALSVQVSAQPQFDERGRLESVIGVASDITTLKRREAELNRALVNQQAVFEAAGEGIAFVRNEKIESANPALSKMLGITRDWMIGRPVRTILADSGAWENVTSAAQEAGARGEAAIHEVMLQVLDGTGRTVWCQLTSRRLGSDVMILVLTDITMLKRREELAWHQANHDELTGLPNRRLLMEHARRLLSVAMRQKRLAAVMVLDLDGFKEVNDLFGHTHGDALLRRVALRLSSVLRECDVVARTGGDEFVALLPDIEQPAAAMVVAEKLIAGASESLEGGGRSLTIHASVGVALFPADGLDFDALLSRADAAMYDAKGAGKNRYRLASEAASVPAPQPASPPP
ncbi:MAG: diguanylate cyclase [Burkholderiales bacterium]|nr:diguanylate cyclase [Burkholderiales bacterium]MCA3230335.1 diguanylate cyclase [Burkholderiales bacterium]